MRAIFLQEAWLQNKASALSFCSLDEPYLRPYLAATVCEDPDTGAVPARLVVHRVAVRAIVDPRQRGVPHHHPRRGGALLGGVQVPDEPIDQIRDLRARKHGTGG